MNIEDLLDQRPCALLGAITKFVEIAGENDAPVVRELLRPLLQSPAMAAFLAEFEGSDQLADLLEEVRREEL
jgi:hypothetical protein